MYVTDCAEVPFVAKVDMEDHNLELWRFFGWDNGSIVAFDDQFWLKSARKVEVAASRRFWCSRGCIFGMPMLRNISPRDTPSSKGLWRKITEKCFLEVWMRLRSIVNYCKLFVLWIAGWGGAAILGASWIQYSDTVILDWNKSILLTCAYSSYAYWFILCRCARIEYLRSAI